MRLINAWKIICPWHQFMIWEIICKWKQRMVRKIACKWMQLIVCECFCKWKLFTLMMKESWVNMSTVHISAAVVVLVNKAFVFNLLLGLWMLLWFGVKINFFETRSQILWMWLLWHVLLYHYFVHDGYETIKYMKFCPKLIMCCCCN